MTAIKGFFYKKIIFRRNLPFINPKTALPAFIAGCMYCCAMVFFYKSAEILTISIAGPIVSILPACIAALWSLFFFKEIEVKII